MKRTIQITFVFFSNIHCFVKLKGKHFSMFNFSNKDIQDIVGLITKSSLNLSADKRIIPTILTPLGLSII